MNAGQTATFTVTATGAPPPGYQWLKNGSSLAGATAATLTLTSVQPADAAAGRLAPEAIDESMLAGRLSAGADEPDLLIRTGGEVRLSNFLLFQAAYTELVFTDVHFPAFRELDFLRIVRTYQQRARRFGK